MLVTLVFAPDLTSELQDSDVFRISLIIRLTIGVIGFYPIRGQTALPGDSELA